MLGTRMGRGMPVAVIVAAMILGSGPAWPKGSRTQNGAPALWIAADRVVGFVPFTVTLYGKVRGAVEPGRLELCREAVIQPDLAASRGSVEDPMAARAARTNAPATPPETVCSTGTLVRTQDGFDYTHEMRFDRPGTYRVRLSMVDAGGHRAISNTVQVNAL